MANEIALDGYVPNSASAQPIRVKDEQDLVLFQVPNDFDPESLEGLQIDINDEDLQLVKFETFTLGIQVCKQETSDYLSKQILPVFQTKDGLDVRVKKMTKVVKIFYYHELPGIQTKAIKKIQPISLKSKARKAK